MIAALHVFVLRAGLRNQLFLKYLYNKVDFRNWMIMFIVNFETFSCFFSCNLTTAKQSFLHWNTRQIGDHRRLTLGVKTCDIFFVAAIVVLLFIVCPFCCTSMVSFTGSYTEDYPIRAVLVANIFGRGFSTKTVLDFRLKSNLRSGSGSMYRSLADNFH